MVEYMQMMHQNLLLRRSCLFLVLKGVCPNLPLLRLLPFLLHYLKIRLYHYHQSLCLYHHHHLPQEMKKEMGFVSGEVEE
ncbi:ORF89 [White spot syndrome virus]|nr:ORF89 [White spot syndrome virus]